MNTETQEALTPSQSAAVAHSNTLFYWICVCPYDTEIKLPTEDKAKYEKGVAMIKDWMNIDAFTREGFMISFNDDYTSLKKWKLF